MAWNGSEGKGTGGTPHRRTAASKRGGGGTAGPFVRDAVAALVVVAGAVLAWWWLAGNGKRPPSQGVVKDKPSASQRNVKSQRNARGKDTKAPGVNTGLAKASEPVEDPATKVVASLACATNEDGLIVETFRTADGKTHKSIRPSRPPIFRHVTDDLLSMVLVEHGFLPPLPLSGNMDREFIESLKDPIVIGEDDSEAVAAKKRAVAELRREVDELMRQGIGFSDILREHSRIFGNNEALRAEAIAELKRMRDSGDTEGTKEYLDRVNDYLRAKGVAPVSMPTTMAERKAERLQKKEGSK